MAIETLRPNAAGDLTEWSSVSGCVNHWECVDEASADDDDTYVYKVGQDAAGQIDLYNLDNHRGGSGTINNVKIYARCRIDGDCGVYTSIQLRVKTEGTVYGPVKMEPGASWVTYSHTYATNPKTGLAWTWDEVDALQVGASNDNANGCTYKLTQVYVEVDCETVYSTNYITAVESWTATGYDQDDVALDVDVTACMTNGTPAEECDEWKEGTLNCKVEIDVGVPPSAITSLKVRFYFTSMMTAGNNALLPYTDANSVSNTNEVVKGYTTPGQWIEHICSSAFITQLGDVGGKCYVRLASGSGGVSGAAKSKLGEVEIEVTLQVYPLSGVTKDKNGSVLGSCEVGLFKVIGEGPPTTYEFVESKTSDAVTGAYTFQVPDGPKYMVYSIKDDTPHVFDATDNVLEGEVT